MGRLPDNYFGPKQRIEMLKKDHPGTKSAILTQAVMQQVGENLVVLIKAIIQVDGKTLAEGHAFTGAPEDDKAVEKAETIAIGRALVNAGYPELMDAEEEEEKAKKPTPVKSSGGLGAAEEAPVKAEVEEADDETEDDESDSEDVEEVEPAPKKTGGLGGRLVASKPKAAEPEETDDEVEDDEETEEPAEAVEEKPKTSKPTREELLKRYGKK